MLRNPDYYFDYFDSLYTSQIGVAADITPSYSGLDTSRLTFIRDRFLNRDITVKAIILIREC